MLLNLLNAKSTNDAAARFVDGGEAALYALIGFAVVFVGIAFLILIVWGVGKFISTNKQETVSKTTGIKEVVKKEKKVVTQPVENVTQNLVVSEEINEETVAIITAAIMAYYEKNNPKCEFTLKRIKRI